MKTINVLGIHLKDYSLKEAVRITEQYMNSGALRTVICVTAGQLVRSASDESIRNWIESADLVVYDDVDIIKKAEGLGEQQNREVQNQEYLDSLFRKMGRSRYGVYLLAESQGKLKQLETEVLAVYENLRITGRGVLEGGEWLQEQADGLINDINNVVPRVIIARLTLETERLFLEEHRQKVNASVFLGLSDEMKLQSKSGGFGRITRYISRTILKRRVMHYVKKGKTEE